MAEGSNGALWNPFLQQTSPAISGWTDSSSVHGAQQLLMCGEQSYVQGPDVQATKNRKPDFDACTLESGDQLEQTDNYGFYDCSFEVDWTCYPEPTPYQNGLYDNVMPPQMSEQQILFTVKSKFDSSMPKPPVISDQIVPRIKYSTDYVSTSSTKVSNTIISVFSDNVQTLADVTRIIHQALSGGLSKKSLKDFKENIKSGYGCVYWTCDINRFYDGHKWNPSRHGLSNCWGWIEDVEDGPRLVKTMHGAMCDDGEALRLVHYSTSERPLPPFEWVEFIDSEPPLLPFELVKLFY